MLAVLLVFGIISLIDSIPASIKMIYSYSRNMLGISPRGDPTETTRLLEEIRHNSPVPLDRLMLCRASTAQVESIVGKWPFVVLGLGQSDMRYYLQKMKTRSIIGRLPRPGEPEAMISQPVATNLKLHLYNPNEPASLRAGSILLSPDNGENYSPKYVKVVGIAQTDRWLMLDSIEYQREYHFPPVDLGLVFAANLIDQNKLDHWADKFFEGKHAQIFAYFQIEKQTNEMFKTLYTILDVAIATLAVVITFMMGMLMNIYQSQRLVEFGLLQAIGYTRKQLLVRVFLESFIVVVIGWLCGVAASVGLLSIADRVLMQPRAFTIATSDPTAFRYTIPLPIAILLVAGLTVWWRFHRFDPVGVVERRLV
jgi:ABC-type lipoprotein release transport system permease subunit